jgi:hypothetical protein
MTWELTTAHCQLGSYTEVAAEGSGMRHCRRSVSDVSALLMAGMHLMLVDYNMGLLNERAEKRIVDLQGMLLVIEPDRLLIDAVLLG